MQLHLRFPSQFIYESEAHSGVGELLEILGRCDDLVVPTALGIYHVFLQYYQRICGSDQEGARRYVAANFDSPAQGPAWANMTACSDLFSLQVKSVQQYHHQLAYCMMQFIMKESVHAVAVSTLRIRGNGRLTSTIAGCARYGQILAVREQFQGDAVLERIGRNIRLSDCGRRACVGQPTGRETRKLRQDLPFSGWCRLHSARD